MTIVLFALNGHAMGALLFSYHGTDSHLYAHPEDTYSVNIHYHHRDPEGTHVFNVITDTVIQWSQIDGAGQVGIPSIKTASDDIHFNSFVDYLTNSADDRISTTLVHGDDGNEFRLIPFSESVILTSHGSASVTDSENYKIESITLTIDTFETWLFNGVGYYDGHIYSMNGGVDGLLLNTLHPLPMYIKIADNTLI